MKNPPQIDNKFKTILISYIIISIIISLIVTYIESFSITNLSISLFYGIVGGYIWYLIIGKYVLMRDDDQSLRSYIILISPIIIFLIWALSSGKIPTASKYLLATLYGIAFLGLCYYRIKQLGYGMFHGSKRLFSKDNLGFIIVLVSYIFLILLAIYVLVIKGYG